MTAVNEVNKDKTKVPHKFFFVVFRSFVLLPNSISKLIHNLDVHVSLSLKLRLHTSMRTNNCMCVSCKLVQFLIGKCGHVFSETLKQVTR